LKERKREGKRENQLKPSLSIVSLRFVSSIETVFFFVTFMTSYTIDPEKISLLASIIIGSFDGEEEWVRKERHNTKE
jgi:hypothetical protein